ncbi:hypothetical protein ACO0QE_004108 [Hanseniaspora vineae]
MSSLRDQLSQIAQQNQGVALDRKKRSKIHSASLIYNPKVASTQDYEYLFETATSALEELISIDPRFQVFTKSLFNESSISLDRNAITNEELKDLNSAINLFLMLANSRWNLTPTLHAAEWLVRRFQIHIHNADYLLFSSLQYYQLPVFKRVLNIIKLPPLWSPLSNFVKSESKNPSNLTIIKLFQDFEFLAEFEKFLHQCIKKNFINSKILCFTTCSLVNLLTHTTSKTENLFVSKIIEIVAKLLMAKNNHSSDCQMSAHTILIVLSKKNLDSKIIMAALETMLSNLHPMTHKSAFIAMASLCQSMEGTISVEQFSIKLYNLIVSKFNNDIQSLIVAHGASFDKFLTSFIRSIIRYDQDRFPDVVELLDTTILQTFEKKIIVTDLIHLSEIIEDKAKLVPVFEKLIAQNDELLILSCLEALGLSGEIFEIRLTTSLFSNNINSGNTEKDIERIVRDVESSKIVGGMTDILPFKEWMSKNAQFCFTSNQSLLSADDDVFNKLLSLFLEALGKKYSIGLFLNSFLTTIEARITFLLRVAVSPASPVALKLVGLSHLSKMFNSIDKDLNLFTLVPVLVTGLFDVSKNVRLSIKKVLQQILKKTDSKNGNFLLIKGIYGDNDLSEVMMSPSDSHNWLNTFLESYNVDNYDLSKAIIHKKSEKVDLLFWCYQIISLPLVYSKSCLLEIVTSCRGYNSNYSQLLQPILETYLEKRGHYKQSCLNNKVDFAKFETNVVSIISMKEKNQFCIDFIIRSLKTDSEQLTEIVCKKLTSVFSSLKPQFQLAIVESIIESSASTLTTEADSANAASELYFDPLGLLQNLNIPSSIFVSILEKNRINADEGNDQMIKRRRRRRSSTAAKSALQKEEISHLAELHLSKITTILETLDSNKNIEANGELLTCLFSHLSDLEVLEQDGGYSVLYAQETLSSCMLNVIESLKKLQQKPTNIRSDIVVSAIRSSPSPQVQNKLLLVIAALATLSPEMILHSVMPIFTFMGAHTIRQDDEYSTHVVENTIKAVVPALMSSSGSKKNELDFLLTTFAAAFPHVPKHRRVKLFTTLINTLNPELAVSPFLFLIGEQYSTSVQKFKISESKEFIAFCRSFLSKLPAVEQLKGILGVFELVAKLPTSFVYFENPEGMREQMLKEALFSNSIINLDYFAVNKLKKNLLQFINKLVVDDSNDYYSDGSLKLKILTLLTDEEADSTSIETAFSSLNKEILEEIEKVSIHFSKSFVHKDVSYESAADANTANHENKAELKDNLLEIKQNLFELLTNTLFLLPIDSYIQSVSPLLSIQYENSVRQHITQSIGERFKFESLETCPAAMEIMSVIFENSKSPESTTELVETSLATINDLVSKFKDSVNTSMLTEALTISTEKILSEHTSISIACLALINNTLQILGVKCISFYPKIIPAALNLMKKHENGSDPLRSQLQIAVVLLFAVVIRKLPMFVVSDLQKIMVAIFFSDEVSEEIKLSVLKLVVENVDLKEVLKTLHKIWQSDVFGKSNVALHTNSVAISLYLSILEATVDKIDKKAATSQSPIFFKLLLSLFEYRSYSAFDNNTLGRIEATVHKIANIYVLKLNDKVFRPLFALVVRWAFDGEGVKHREISREDRLCAFFKFFNKLQDHLKSIITSYFTYLLDNTNKLLLEFSRGQTSNINLRRLVLIAVGSSFKYDRDEYWRSTARFELIGETLINQLRNIEPTIGKYLVKAIGSLASCNKGSEDHNKAMNKLLISHMKSNCKSNEKLWAVRSVKLIYTKVGETWLTLLPQLVPIVAELLEDDDEQVEYEVRTGLVKVFENVLGEPFDRYLD